MIFPKRLISNQTLGFLNRNIRIHNRDMKSTTYKTFVRPQLEYASTVWSPYTDQYIDKLESVQRRAARRVNRDYTSTVKSELTVTVSALLVHLI